MKKLYLLFLMGGFLGSFPTAKDQSESANQRSYGGKKRVQPPGEDLSDTGV